MKEVRIYSARYCPYCASAKALLKRKGIAFTDVDIGGNWELRDEMIARSNGRVTVPQIFVGSVHVGGSDDLHELERTGQLDRLLAEPADATAR
jgi:glutaredoxin 3